MRPRRGMGILLGIYGILGLRVHETVYGVIQCEDYFFAGLFGGKTGGTVQPAVSACLLVEITSTDFILQNVIEIPYTVHYYFYIIPAELPHNPISHAPSRDQES